MSKKNMLFTDVYLYISAPKNVNYIKNRACDI